jgi:hypothetical protein
MVFRHARATLGQVFYQRCFYLFFAILLLIVGIPLIEQMPYGRMASGTIHMLMIVSIVAALLLAVPSLVFQWLHLSEHFPRAEILWLGFGVALYILTLGYLLYYVFRQDVMTSDKLYGAASAYLLIGVLWAYIYALVEQVHPNSFAIAGATATPSVNEFMYFSFTTLTSTGFGDVLPLSRQARSWCIVEQVVGTMFVAILIARLSGVYPPRPVGDK